jgi:hypothetical protein
MCKSVTQRFRCAKCMIPSNSVYNPSTKKWLDAGPGPTERAMTELKPCGFYNLDGDKKCSKTKQKPKVVYE